MFALFYPETRKNLWSDRMVGAVMKPMSMPQIHSSAHWNSE